MESSLRRGLPRVPGGEAWPPEDTPAPDTDFILPTLASTIETPVRPESIERAPTSPEPVPTSSAGTGTPTFRRGLPRVVGGAPWPPAESAPVGYAPAVAGAPASKTSGPSGRAPQPDVPAPLEPSSTAETLAPDAALAEGSQATISGLARRGLPRSPGGEAWPPAETEVANAFAAAPMRKAPAPAPAIPPATSSQQAPAATIRQPLGSPGSDSPASMKDPVPPREAPVAEPVEPAPAATAPAAHAGSMPTSPPLQKLAPEPAAESKKYGPFTINQWIGAGAVVALAIVGAVTLVVLAARWLAGLDFMSSFLAKYPGEYELPESAPIGFPGWLGWQHFFNIFLMVLIIRSGYLVRKQERPEAFWASKKNPKKISIQLWFHQSLNILWVVNGAIFIILLFATGQWMRVIPTSPEVFPNAVSALVQYLTLDWPLDNGWVNYNSLQQLAYFATIFIAAPLSAITGYRMSESWPRESKLSGKFPVEWARKLHFPLMIYFVAFIIVHVALVFSTGALRNLNHMFAAQGSVDPSVYANNWTGFWLFVASMVVVVGSWVAARPMVLAPIARIFGNVSAR